MALWGSVEYNLFVPPSGRIPSYGRLPQSVTSLTISVGTTAFVQIQDIMVQLPNLDDLWLSGSSVMLDWRTPPSIGSALKGRFGGQLRLLEGYANTHVMNMLLEVPTGLHFTEVYINATRECLLSTVRLTEACGKTLVKLSYAVSLYGKSHPFFLSSYSWRMKCWR